MQKHLYFLLFAVALSLFSACKDKCDSVACLNGGSCSEGICECPAGFSGTSCEIRQTPTAMRITRIVVTSFPSLDANGDDWDLTSRADIYPVVYQEGSSSFLYTSDTYNEDASAGLSYSYTVGGTLSLSVNNSYVIGLYDYDTPDPDDFIGGLSFTPADIFPATGVLPTSYTITAGGSLSFQIDVAYTY